MESKFLNFDNKNEQIHQEPKRKFLELAKSYVENTQQALTKTIAIFEQYKDYLENAKYSFEFGRTPAADLPPEEFINLVEAIKKNPLGDSVLYLVHGAFSEDSIPRKISIKYLTGEMDAQNIKKYATDIFLTDLDRVKGQEHYNEIMGKLKELESDPFREIKQDTTEEKVYCLS